jgi:hypothetical protein
MACSGFAGAARLLGAIADACLGPKRVITEYRLVLVEPKAPQPPTDVRDDAPCYLQWMIVQTKARV